MQDTPLHPTEDGPPDPEGGDLMTLSYRSLAAPDLTEASVESLVARAQRFNARAGITGVLLYDTTYFLQILEGPLEEVTQLFSTISADPRHAEVRPFAIRWLGARRFEDWSMQLLGPIATRQVTEDMDRMDHASAGRIDRLVRDVLGLLRR